MRPSVRGIRCRVLGRNLYRSGGKKMKEETCKRPDDLPGQQMLPFSLEGEHAGDETAKSDQNGPGDLDSPTQRVS